MKIFNISSVEVVLDYPFLADKGFDPIKWFLNPSIGKEQQNARQAFYGLTEEERAVKQFEHNVSFLAAQSDTPPEGLPGFEHKKGDLAASISAFLLPASDDSVIVKMVEDAQTEYFRRTQPKVFFRSV